MAKYLGGEIRFTLEQRKGDYVPVGSWTIPIEGLNKLICERFEDTYSRDLIWKVVRASANLRETRHRVRKKLPMGLPATKKAEKKATVFLAGVVAKHLDAFDRRIEKFLAAEEEKKREHASPTFREFSEQHYLTRFFDPDGEPTGTFIRRRTSFQNWIWPVLGNLRLDEIKASDIDALVIRARKGATVTHWKTGKRKKLKPQSENTTYLWWTIVKTVLSLARSMDEGDIEDGKEPFRLRGRNPFDVRRLNHRPSRKNHTQIPPTAAQNKSLIEWVEKNDPDLLPVLSVAIFTGMRIGEVLALEWRHVHWETLRIDVVQQVCQKTLKIKPTKTGSKTSRNLLPPVVKILSEWKSDAAHADEVLKRCVRTRVGTLLMRGVNGGRLPICQSDTFIFARPDSTPYRYMTLLGKLNAALDAVGIKSKGAAFHAFRRSFCSELASRLKGRGGLMIVKELSGHATIQAVEKYIYDINRDENMKALEQAFLDAYGEGFLEPKNE